MVFRLFKKFLGKLVYMVYNSSYMDFANAFLDQEKINVTRASASTYLPQELSRQGLEITLNIGNAKVRSVGSPAVYPEIVVWRPDYPGSQSGQAVIVEEIETSASLTEPRIQEWKLLSSAGITFNLVIPAESVVYVRTLLVTNDIRGVKIQSWQRDNNTGRYFFDNP